MITKEDEYFLRASILLLKGGRLMSKETLYKELQKAGGNLAELLKQHERKFKHKFVKKQREKLFPDAGETDVETWDLAMLTTVTLKVFKQSLNDDEKNGLKSIKCMRDEIYAHTYSSALSADQYEEIRNELQNALTSLSNGLSEKLKDDCSKIIQECTTGPVSPSLKAELTKQIEDTENSFQAVMNKLGNQNEFLCEMKKEIMDKLNTIRVTEDRSEKIIKVIDISLTLSGAVNESNDIYFVEGIITTVINKAIKKVGNENEKDYPKIRSVVDKILKDIENMPDVQILSAEHKCILLKFSFTTYIGILNMLMYLESRSFLDSLNDLALALSSTIPNLSGQFQLDATVTPECMKDLLDELRAKTMETTKYERTVRVPMKVESVQGIEHIWSLFETGGATNRLNELSEAVFDELNTKITVTPSVNLEQVQAAIEEAGEQSTEVSQPAVNDNASSPQRHQSKSIDEGEQSTEVSQPAVKDNDSSPQRHKSKSIDEGEQSTEVSQPAVKDNASFPQRHQSKSIDEGEQSTEVSQPAVKDNASSPQRHKSKSIDEGEKSAEVSQAAVEDNASSPQRHQSKSADKDVARAASMDTHLMCENPGLSTCPEAVKGKMADKYYRLVTILVNICSGPLRELFLKHAAADPNLQTPYTTLDAYLAFRKKDIMKLKSEKFLRQDQTNMLFPPQGQGPADINTWDLTLLSLMLTEMFKQQLQPTDLTNIHDIRGIRNNLQHISGTCQITESRFLNMYHQLLSNTVQLALSAKGHGYADKIKQDIETAATSVLEDLGDVLRQWYVAEISKLKDNIEQLKEKIDEIQKCTSTTTKTLNKTTVKRTLRPGGKIIKRLKTVDPILENMRDSFSSLMNNELESDFQSPPEAARITSELEEHHLVVVSGYGKGLYLQTALSVIDSRDYDENRCVLVSTPSDWRHIGAEDAELVVFLHPFGKNQFDDYKAESMNAILDSIMSLVSVNDEDELFDVIIITDQSILDEYKKHFSHDLIENPISVYKPTTEDSPVDLVEGESAMYQVGTDPHYRNLLVQSIAYCKHHRMQLVDNNLKEDALELFRSKKVIVISGPRGSGKTTLALSLLSSYQEGHYLILTEPEDSSYIRFGVTSVIVIEDLGGKYTFEMAVVQKWLRKFDMLYSAVKDGKLNIIITCVPDKLNEYIVDTSKHPILEAVFTLPKRRVVKIKQEPSSDACGEKCAGITFSKSENNQLTTAFTRVKKTTSNILDNVDDSYEYNENHICQHPDGSFLVLVLLNLLVYDDDDDHLRKTLIIHHFSSDFQYIRKYNTDISVDTYYYGYDICCTDNGYVVIAVRNEATLYRITDGTIQNINSTKLHEDALITNLCFFMNQIYMFCFHKDGAVLKMDTNLNIKKQGKLYLDFYKDIDILPEVVPCVMQKYVYIHPVHDIIICDNPKKKQIKYLQVEGFKPTNICAASEDSVFVVGGQDSGDQRILHVNTDMEILSDIPLKNEKSYPERIVYDKANTRLILYTGKKEVKQIYLE